MTVKPYDREHAMALLEPSGYTDEWTIDDRGVWPHEHHKLLHASGMDSHYQLAWWKPASVFADAPDAPDLSKTPALPFPFDGRDLAAFMLTGYGCLVAEFYGDWESGPGAHKLSRIDPDNNFAKRAVIEAFDAYRNAVGRVGRLDLELYRRSCESCEAYCAARSEAIERHDTQAVAHPKPDDSDDRRREMEAEYTRRMALINAELEAQDAEMSQLQAEWEAAYQTWLTAMVVCLLGPKLQAATEAPAPASDKARRDLLAPAIEAAQKLCENQFDAPAVWAALAQMAQDGKRPLLGLTEDGIKWNDANDNPQFLRLRNLRDRLRRSKNKSL